MSNIQAAIGCGQMERIEELMDRKREIFAHYREQLACLPGISVNTERKGTDNGAWMPTAVFAPATGVSAKRCRPHLLHRTSMPGCSSIRFPALPMFTPKRENHFAWDIPQRAINLPSYHDMTEEDLGRVIDVVRGIHHA